MFLKTRGSCFALDICLIFTYAVTSSLFVELYSDLFGFALFLAACLPSPERHIYIYIYNMWGQDCVVSIFCFVKHSYIIFDEEREDQSSHSYFVVWAHGRGEIPLLPLCSPMTLQKYTFFLNKPNVLYKKIYNTTIYDLLDWRGRSGLPPHPAIVLSDNGLPKNTQIRTNPNNLPVPQRRRRPRPGAKRGNSYRPANGKKLIYTTIHDLTRRHTTYICIYMYL